MSIQTNQSPGLLWQATWQSTALAALVVIVILALRPWLPTQWRVVWWTLPRLRMQMSDWKSDLKARVEQAGLSEPNLATAARLYRLQSLLHY